MTTNTRLFPLLAPLAILLGGCPIYIDDNHGHSAGSYYCDDYGCYQCDDTGCWDDGTGGCAVDSDCIDGNYCSSGVCVAAPACDYGHECPNGFSCDYARMTCLPDQIDTTCVTSEDCFGGEYCAEGVCIETSACSIDDECAVLGENMICDAERGTCIPDLGPCPDGACGCVVDQDCTQGLVCEAGLCLAPANICQTDTECGQGRVCDGAFCAKTCGTDGLCPTGQACGADAVCRDIVGGLGECVYSSECAVDNECINATCFKACGDDSVCGGFEFCDHGACRPDTRPL